MGLKDVFSRASEHVIESYDEDGKTRPPELAELERELHEGLSSWTEDHIRRYPKMGRLPYRPDLFPDQRLDKPFRPISSVARAIATAERSDKAILRATRPAIYLGRLAYFESLKFAHAKTVGSKALSETMVLGFLTAPAVSTEFESLSMAQYAAKNLEEDKRDMTIGLTSGHLSTLADVGEFAGALNIAMAELYGFKYIDRVNTLINTNMTRQTYRVSRVPIPIPWLVSGGTGIYWGMPPGESAEKHGIGSKPMDETNRKFVQAFLEHKKKKSMVLAYVPTGSAATQVKNQQTGILEKIIFKDPSFSAPLTVRCGGGIIPVNRFGEQIVIGSVIKSKKPSGVTKKDYEKILTDEVMQEHVAQAQELTDVPIEYIKLYPETHLAQSVPEV